MQAGKHELTVLIRIRKARTNFMAAAASAANWRPPLHVYESANKCMQLFLARAASQVSTRKVDAPA
jgi:hypothetical protein